jgi:hypothetical protein
MPSTGPFYPHGFQEQFFAAVETTFDTDTKPAAAEGMSILESDFSPENDILMSDEKTGNRMTADIFKGLRRAKGSMKFMLKPAAVGVVPNGGAVIEGALSNKTIVGGTSVTYAHQDVPAVKTLRMSRGVGEGLMEQIYGAAITQLMFEVKAGEVPVCSASFEAARIARAKSAVLTAAATISTGTCAVAAGQGARFDKGTTIRFKKVGGTYEDNAGLGYLVTSDKADTVTFAPVAVSTAAIGDEIVAFTPTPTLVGTAVAAVSHDCSFGGTSFNFNEAKVTYKSGLNVKPEANADRPTRAFAGESVVEGEATVYAQEQQGLGESIDTHWQKTFSAFVLRAGLAAAGVHVKFSMANAMVECVPIKVPPGQGVAGATALLKFRAKSAFSVVLD